MKLYQYTANLYKPQPKQTKLYLSYQILLSHAKNSNKLDQILRYHKILTTLIMKYLKESLQSQTTETTETVKEPF